MIDAIVIPMAGEGKRFQDEGYTIPKPLIEVDSEPMIIRVMEDLPTSKKQVFITRKEHNENFGLHEKLKSKFPNSIQISLDYTTDGQATTCNLGLETIGDEESILIAPCDNGMKYDEKKFFQLTQDKETTAIIWTFRGNATVKRNPKMYGWVKTNSDIATNVSCKVPISDTPINDHAIIGTFWFRHAKDYREAYKSMIQKNRRVNNEFYVDELMNEVIDAKKKVRVFEIDTYVGFGTPNDLRTYMYWKKFFKEDYNLK
ncbi:MAG: sugar phosphate nucleotidyltransferase [Leptospiraceae bacterium]|nr:sugar phosphate nucleotidyltransferase [Leptospiraceae bacterium]